MLEMQVTTLQQMLGAQINDPGLLNALGAQSIGQMLKDLEQLPDELYRSAVDLEDVNQKVTQINKQINEAHNNLAIAEATAISFPDPSRELKNAEQRKAYVTEMTCNEQRILTELQNKKLDFEAERLELQNEFNRLNDKLSGTKYRARVISSLLEYLGR